MRRFIFAAAAIAACTGASLLISNNAAAIALPGATHVVGAPKSSEPVYMSCSRFWNGVRWVHNCIEIAPGYGGSYSPGYGEADYGYYGKWRPHYRFRFFGYY